MLQNQVEIIEALALTTPVEIALWVCVPGAILTGQAVSRKRFTEEFEETAAPAVRSAETGETIPLDSLSEIGLSHAIVPDEHAAEYLNLIEAAIVGGPPLRLPWARVRLGDVAAWGFGLIP